LEVGFHKITLATIKVPTLPGEGRGGKLLTINEVPFHGSAVGVITNSMALD